MSGKDIFELVQELEPCSFDELCERHLLDADFIVQCVEFGVIEVESAGHARTQWSFTTQSVLRLEKARRLQRDLEIGLQDMALVLDLVDEIETLRLEVDTLRQRLRHWEPSE